MFASQSRRTQPLDLVTNSESCLNSDVLDWASIFQVGSFLSPTEPPVAVPPEQVALAGLGRLEEDGHLWTLQPDGAELGITPKTLSARSAFSAAAFRALAPASTAASTDGPLPPEQKYTLRIFSGSQDVTDTNVNALVGQRLVLTCQLAPEGGPPLTNYQWTVPGTALTNFYVSTDALQTNGYPVPLTQKTSNTVRFCWVDPGTKVVRCKAMADGQEWSARTYFRVKRPNATLTANIQAGVEVYNNLLRFGNNAFAGIDFMPRNKDTDGVWQYIQIGHQLARYQTAGTNTWSRAEGSGLDSWYPNPNDRDAPWTSLPSDASVTTITGTYTTYLAFRATLDDILVPIREITWSWDGQAATNGSGQWVGGGSAQVDPQDLEAPATISWTNNMLTTLTNRIPEN